MMLEQAPPAGGRAFFEPHGGPFTWWQRRALTCLSEAGTLPWADLAGPDCGRVRPAVRRFLRWLEAGRVVAWDPYRLVFRVDDPAALARLIRWDAQRRLTAAYRAGKVTDATAKAASW